MKRLYFSAAFLAAGLLLIGTLQLQAQQSSDKIVIIKKIKNDDGTMTVKKKSVDKGADANEYINHLELNCNEKDVHVTVLTDEIKHETGDNLKTVMYIRKSGDQKEVRWKEFDNKRLEFEKLRVTMPTEPSGWTGIETKKAFLGVNPETRAEGVYLTGIVIGSGAEAAGLKKGDVLTAINGAGLQGTGLTGELAKYKPGDEVLISYLRDGQLGQTTAKLTETRSSYSYNYSFKRDPCKVFFGVYVGSYGNGKEGVGVSGIVAGDNWPAEVAGLQGGDRILAIDGVPVNSHYELVTERDKHKPGERFTFTYLRDGVTSTIEARFKECPNDIEKEEPVEEIEEIIEMPEEKVIVDEVIVEQAQPQTPPVQQLEINGFSLQLEEFNAYPNPTFGNLNVQFKGEAVPTNIRISDVSGRILYEEQMNNFDGYYSRELDVSKGTPGTLMLSISQNGKVSTKPVVLLNRA